jgi:ABC transporter substrate binding protein
VIPQSTWRALPATQAFLSGLHDLGYDEGRNFAIEYRWTEGDLKRLPAIAAEVVVLNVDVISQNTCGAGLNAARQATKTIPIVVAACDDDMTETGIIGSLARPGGNVTGLNPGIDGEALGRAQGGTSRGHQCGGSLEPRLFVMLKNRCPVNCASSSASSRSW